MKLRVAILALLGLSFVLVDFADARGRRRRRRYRNYTTTYSAVPHYNVSFSATTPQGLAEQKAQWQADNCGYNCAHPGGGYAGAYAEGVGFSAYSAQDALNKCCFTGQRVVAGQAVVRGGLGWYACKIYW